ncbi:MAG TPA: right-handed parallel beta-helix repeat-containing protein [Caulifigura sp.]|nr:right-handed parallel beta-helix repeat-containing protein [Caulifigura sp.]
MKPIWTLIAAMILWVPEMLPAAEVPYQPAWANIAPRRVIRHSEPRGGSLVKAIAGLKPGDELVIASGTYSVGPMWDLRISGTAEAPIWITAEKDATVIFTRADAKQNVLNIGQGGPVQYLCLRGIELTGGSHGLRLGQCSHVWIDGCHIHHTGGVCLSANSADTHHLFLTNNHIHHGSGHAEGMYLGANNGDHIMSESVIAKNHIHDCDGDQGDGIEVKQGSWGNLIAENDVHDTNYPCITVYGTAGKPVNIIERNLCRRSNDNTMQVQGEAIVRNNVLIGAKGSAFASTDHQGKTLNLQVVHNTIINTGRAFSGSSWNAREGMVLANNVIYSRDKDALHFANGSTGVTITGNIIFDAGPKRGGIPGRGLDDFTNLTWDSAAANAKPTSKAPFDHADAKYLLETDFHGAKRTSPTSGAISR